MTDTTTAEEPYKLPPRPPRKLGIDGWRSASYRDEKDQKKIIFALGRKHMVRRLTFVDGVDWVVRVYLLCDDVNPKTVYRIFNREVAAAAFLRSKTSIRVPEIFDWNWTVTPSDNAAGIPYMFMEYIHGTTPNQPGWLELGEDDMYPTYGTREQHYKLLDQLARIHAELASWKFRKIGDLCWAEGRAKLYIGPMPETRDEGPWGSAADFYDEFDTGPSSRSHGVVTPVLLLDVLRKVGRDPEGPFRLWNRNLGPQNCLLDLDYNIVAITDLDGICSVPLDVVARFPIQHPDERSMEWYAARLAAHEAEFGEEDAPVANHLESMASSAFEGLSRFRYISDEQRDEWFESALQMLVACGLRPAPWDENYETPSLSPVSPSSSAESSGVPSLPWTCRCVRRGTASTDGTCSTDATSASECASRKKVVELAEALAAFELGDPLPSPSPPPSSGCRPTDGSVEALSPRDQGMPPPLPPPAEEPPHAEPEPKRGAATSAGYIRRLMHALAATWTDALPLAYEAPSPTDSWGSTDSGHRSSDSSIYPKLTGEMQRRIEMPSPDFPNDSDLRYVAVSPHGCACNTHRERVARPSTVAESVEACALSD
ncbi:hypothetical protein CPLU01_08863 [Colletotrichum plurivorum]|uniref:Aminoglycoside phosphotransferase domain-containing protein n=1 Tax=Colletotrichum plurivorum TaxID=2175906 RepID=A0A8H6KA70_9PEZI|nr:hypothetical protein CPLU01_08863 [Colletotrichum plurivorum]